MVLDIREGRYVPLGGNVRAWSWMQGLQRDGLEYKPGKAHSIRPKKGKSAGRKSLPWLLFLAEWEEKDW
ncbi:hypothetical protein JCM31598_36900 [Desulfonatronum parangueonense]